MEDMLRIGVVTKPHGIRGEVKVYPTTDDIKRFDKTDEVILVAKGENMTLHVEHAKYFKNMVILKFREFNNINEVEQLRQCDIMVTRENALPLKEGQFYFCDVIGAKVLDEDGLEIGIVKDVIETGANNVFSIETGGAEKCCFPSFQSALKKWTQKKVLSLPM